MEPCASWRMKDAAFDTVVWAFWRLEKAFK